MPPFRALLFLFTYSRLRCRSHRPQAGASPTPSDSVGRSIHVDPAKGDDTHDGVTGPVRTIARGIRLAQPGDTIHLATATYYESVDLSGKHERTRPTHHTSMATAPLLEGSDPVRLAEWESLGQGLYRKVKLIPHMNDAILMRWFFLLDNKMNRMSRCSKGPSATSKKPVESAAGRVDLCEGKRTPFICKTPSDKSSDSVDIRYPVRSSGVAFSREGSHLVVRNLTATHVHNDGFNIHGAQRELVFENIAAIECGDDGFSAHEDGDCRIDGFVSIGNCHRPVRHGYQPHLLQKRLHEGLRRL